MFVWLIQWVCINIGKKNCLDLKKRSDTTYLGFDVISNPLMYLFGCFLFLYFFGTENKQDLDGCWNKTFLTWPLWILCFPVWFRPLQQQRPLEVTCRSFSSCVLSLASCCHKAQMGASLHSHQMALYFTACLSLWPRCPLNSHTLCMALNASFCRVDIPVCIPALSHTHTHTHPQATYKLHF